MVQVPQGICDSLELMDLPSMPQILLRFLHLADDENSSLIQLSTLVSQDPALSARILMVANSVAFRRNTSINSIEQCLITLGTRLSRTLAASLVIQNTFSPSAITSQYDLSCFWMHSLQVSDVCRGIAEQCNYPDPDEAYLAGLLHDIGQLLLLGGIEDRYGSLLSSSRDESVLRVFEEQRLGTDHASVGAWLVDRWGLSSSFMADAVLFHHAESEDIKLADTLSQIVWTAHLVCHHAKLYSFEQVIFPTDFETSEELLQVDFFRAAELYKRATQRTVIIAEALGITVPDDGRTLPVSRDVFDPDAPKLVPAEKVLTATDETVRNMALLKPLQQDLFSVKIEDELYVAAQESARILFGLSSVAFLMLRQDQQLLQGVDGNFQQELLQRVVIHLDASVSLAAATFLEKSPHCTLSDEGRSVISLLDVQIGRIMKSEGLLYLPMIGRHSTMGVMVCGVSSLHGRRLLKRISWLSSFTHAVAIGIETWRELQKQIKIRETGITKQFEHHLRKVVHEAANPLGVINNYLSIMTRKLPQDANIMHEMDILKDEIGRVSQILRGMDSIVEAATCDTSVNINSLISSMLLLYRESMFESRGISVQTQLDPELPTADLDQDSLKQIIFNLLNNASDALEQGGGVQIITRSGFIHDGYPNVEVSIQDNGPGLPSDVIQRLFSPLDANRRPRHSGMGLSIVADLVKKNNGYITCQSKPNQGTCFSILLPLERRK